MIYLTDEEIPIYCDTITGVTSGMVRVASTLIDTFLGKEFGVKQYVETATINKKRRGKLKHSPVISIDNIKVMSIDPNFGVMAQDVPASNCFVDPECDGYFTYVGTSLACQIFGTNPNKIQVTYTAGHDTIPEQLKVACAMLAQNIKSKGSFAGETQLSTLDYKVMLMDDSLFTSDIRMILRQYKGGV